MQIIKDIFNLPQGAIWLKADLHVHTPASKDFSEKWADSTESILAMSESTRGKPGGVYGKASHHQW